MDKPTTQRPSADNAAKFSTERFIAATYDGLSPDAKVLVALFAAMSGSAATTQGFGLPEHLRDIVGFGSAGPLTGQSEQANWLKGVCDGVLLVIEHM